MKYYKEYKAGFTPDFVAAALNIKAAAEVEIPLNYGLKSTHVIMNPDGETREIIDHHIKEGNYMSAGRTLIAGCRLAGDTVHSLIKDRLAFEAVKAYVAKTGKALPGWLEVPVVPGEDLQ